MISISKISSISTMPKTKNVSKVVLPATSSLGVLAGSSLGEGFPPSNIEHMEQVQKILLLINLNIPEI